MKLPKVRRELKFSLVVVLLALVLEKLTVVQSLLAMFGYERLLPDAFINFAKGISSNSIYLGSVVILAGFPLAFWLASLRIEHRLNRQISQLESALSDLIDAIRASENLDKSKRSTLLMPLLQKVTGVLPGGSDIYRSLIVEPLENGAIISIANSGVPLKRIEQLERDTNWMTNQSYFRRALDHHVETKPPSGRDAMILVSGKNHGYLEDRPDPNYKAGVAHLLITLDRDHAIRQPSAPLDPLAIAIVSISCTEHDVLQPGDESALIKRVEPVLNAVDSVLFMFRAVERLRGTPRSTA